MANKSTCPISNQADLYFQLNRGDVAALVPNECRAILEIGSGFGVLGRALTGRQPCTVDGVEINPDATAHLTGVYRRFWIGDVAQVEMEGSLLDYDCLLFPDVLEHLVDPWATLRRFCTVLRPGGVVVASIPNVRNLGLVYRLIVQGAWEYESSGLLDRGHLRFFTRKSIADMFAQSGLQIEVWQYNRDCYVGIRRIVAWAARLLVPEIDVCQYLVRARKV
jgi:2-polyprenyl-3-methyl-5-hydroxy-6-metoxy-1,4-benzoquinol methylase